jgi:hypothetical protein
MRASSRVVQPRLRRDESASHTSAPSLTRIAGHDAPGACGCVASDLRTLLRGQQRRPACAALCMAMRSKPAAGAMRRPLQARLSGRPVVMMRKVRALQHSGAAQRQEHGLTGRSSGASQSLHGGWASFVGLRAVGAAQGCVRGLAGRAWCAHSAWCRRRLGRERWVSVGHASDVPDGLDRAWLRRRTHMDRIGLARSGVLVVAACAGGGWCACEA